MNPIGTTVKKLGSKFLIHVIAIAFFVQCKILQKLFIKIFGISKFNVYNKSKGYLTFSMKGSEENELLQGSLYLGTLVPVGFEAICAFICKT